jgi:CRISPR-associated protein Cas4
MIFLEEQINGSLVNAYIVCKRQAWLYAHQVHGDQNNEYLLMGKALAQAQENKNLHEYPFGNLVFDKLSKESGHYLVTEYKKSLKNVSAGEMQLLFYIYCLKKGLNLKEVKGKLVCGKKTIPVDDSEENFKKMEQIIKEIIELVSQEKPPKFVPIRYCKTCSYQDYCC